MTFHYGLHDCDNTDEGQTKRKRGPKPKKYWVGELHTLELSNMYRGLVTVYTVDFESTRMSLQGEFIKKEWESQDGIVLVFNFNTLLLWIFLE